MSIVIKLYQMCHVNCNKTLCAMSNGPNWASLDATDAGFSKRAVGVMCDQIKDNSHTNLIALGPI